MMRGIHLKRLRTTDLELLGVADARDMQAEANPSALAEADPALSLVVTEVRQGLERTLRLLDEVLSASRPARLAQDPAKARAQRGA